MESTIKARQVRIEIVNTIIEEIANRSRGFFKGKNITAHFVYDETKKRLYYVDQYSEKRIYMHFPEYRKPRGFTNGGTMWGLVKDFKLFIMKGEYSNGKNGYGGLYCPHWGYSEEDMIALRNKAIELEYLIKK
jgi:hypothetical protein